MIMNIARHSWYQFGFLYIATVVAQLANVVYQQIQSGSSISVVLLPSLAFLSLLTVPSLWLGLSLGQKLNLGLTNSSVLQNGETKAGILFCLYSALLLGIFLLALRFYLSPYLPAEIPEYGFRGVLGGLLVSIGAAVAEEVWFRYGLMTLVLWLFTKIFNLSRISSTVALMCAVLISVPFALAHLPQLQSYGAATNFAIWATILGNISVGTLYGWCYWRYGLLFACVCHFFLDTVLHVFPALY